MSVNAMGNGEFRFGNLLQQRLVFGVESRYLLRI
jgi:hypothetical protein